MYRAIAVAAFLVLAAFVADAQYNFTQSLSVNGVNVCLEDGTNCPNHTKIAKSYGQLGQDNYNTGVDPPGMCGGSLSLGSSGAWFNVANFSASPNMSNFQMDGTSGLQYTGADSGVFSVSYDMTFIMTEDNMQVEACLAKESAVAQAGCCDVVETEKKDRSTKFGSTCNVNVAQNDIITIWVRDNQNRGGSINVCFAGLGAME